MKHRPGVCLDLVAWIALCSLTAAAVLRPCDVSAQTPSAVPADSSVGSAHGEQRANPEDATVSTVVVTGTSISSAQAAAFESAPISIVTSEQLQSSGATNVEDYFKTQPDFVLSGQSSYTNTTNASGLTGTNIGGTNLNLRGIGPQYTLVLLNGRRFQAENPANLDLIPLDAIDRIEILKSGASAIYGSDAVAGVVNIITKHSADGLVLNGFDGLSSAHDNDTARLSASWGAKSEQGDFFAVAEYYDRHGLTQGQRALSADPDLSRFNPNFDYQPFRYTSPAQIVLPDGTSPLVLDQQAFTCGQYSQNPADYTPLNGHVYAKSCDARLNDDQRSLINPQRRATLFMNGDYNLATNTRLYADFDFARSLTHSVGYDYGVDGYGDPNSPLQLTPIPANYYWNPFGVAIDSVTYGVPEAGPQTLDIDTSAWRLNLGIQGQLDRVHYDVGGAIYRAYTNLNAYNLPTNAGLYAAENRPGAAAINLFCNACNTPAQIAGVYGAANTQNWELMGLLNAHAYAPILTLPSGDINIAAGAEWQRDTYKVQPSAFVLNFGLNDTEEGAADAGRHYTSVYVEGQLPVFGNQFTFPGAASLGIDAAARFESIQDAGSRTDPTVSVRWEPMANTLALRASYGTSFRAPSLNDVNGGTTTTQITLINPQSGQSQYYVGTTGANLNLKPETATYKTFGIAFTPPAIPGLTATVDRWFIDQKNIVIQTSAQLVLEGIQPGTLFTASNGEQGIIYTYENAAGQQVNGTDLDLDYRFHTSTAGAFDFRVAGTYLNSFRVNDSAGAGYVQYAGNTALASSLSAVTGLPKLRFLATANWSYQALGATYLLHYVGSYLDPTIPPDVKVASYVTHDLQLTFDVSKLPAASGWWSGLKFTLGVNDLTDTKPPVFFAGPDGGGLAANGYDTSIVDPTGRFFYVAVKLSLANPH
jgi:iron complex outermembrane recepter protein